MDLNLVVVFILLVAQAVVVTPNVKITSLLPHYCNFATIINHNINI